MKKLVFLTVIAVTFGFAKVDAANPGVNCDLLADVTANLMSNAGFDHDQILDATYDAFWNCYNGGGSSNRL